MKNFHYHFPDANRDLSPLTTSMLEVFNVISQKMLSVTEAIETTVVVSHSPENSIPELGISGQYTKKTSCIDIYLDIDNPHLKKNFKAEISRTFIHEYMHAIREQYVEWEDGTLLDSLVAEGLAQSFETEIQVDLSASIYSVALSENELSDVWEKAKKVLNQKGDVNDEWFYGSDTLARWSGYSLGYKLVQDKIKSSGLKASELYKLPSVEFLTNVKIDT